MVHTGPVSRLRLVAVALVGFVGAVTMACSSSDGRGLPPPDADQTTTTASPPVIQAPAAPTGAFSLQSTSFLDGGALPERFTCIGAATSPDLSWTGTPTDAVELAIVVRDRDAGGFVHWVVTGIDPFVLGIGEDGVPENAIEGPNGAAEIGWLGPCPPSGSGTHTYEVALLALTAVVALPPVGTADDVAGLLEASASRRAILTGTVTAGG